MAAFALLFFGIAAACVGMAAVLAGASGMALTPLLEGCSAGGAVLFVLIVIAIKRWE